MTLGVLVQLKLPRLAQAFPFDFGSARESEKAGLVLGLGLEQIIALTLLSLLAI